MMTPTNDVVWPQMYAAYIQSQKDIGRKYVADLFKGLRRSLGLPD